MCAAHCSHPLWNQHFQTAIKMAIFGGIGHSVFEHGLRFTAGGVQCQRCGFDLATFGQAATAHTLFTTVGAQAVLALEVCCLKAQQFFGPRTPVADVSVLVDRKHRSIGHDERDHARQRFALSACQAACTGKKIRGYLFHFWIMERFM